MGSIKSANLENMCKKYIMQIINYAKSTEK